MFRKKFSKKSVVSLAPPAPAEPAKPARTIPEVQAEYQSLCTRAGHTQYQIATLSRDLDALNETLRDLNLEASKIQAAENEAKAPAAPAASEAPNA